ncbi:hypothetical protein AN6350.2 [Aspergillus nidulans FGSC A4]|uniref:Uncharacterized protein n=1 Tax=Emericella nidulans (strain FGSC A4 / ATCC 38163 / CBS 112.46 / NRRL 194 / M139) TaxID=227321 RepID=Q5AZD0_EMENI|nr:hypothetical protein [Aspergillus nidulans FGSC A4]EAA58734.1 hypothetical protein AN6350.2 [Aspergillus nidulans FGSC A4]CBF69646.1 TPA: hypothetical protein ANIA_06350 [Aspergillus nidulans FGSC A4]|eukprot:XP_663954.1 hypothetical protein AN6350.2 [Aspergillus nidulans FGSC A4]
MNENTIIAIIIIAVLGSIAGGTFYIYYLHANVKKELTIARIESQREREQQLKAVAATMEQARRASQARSCAQARTQSRPPSRGRSRPRSRPREASLGRTQDQATGKKGKKWKKTQDHEQHQKQEEARSRRSSRKPNPSRAGSLRTTQGEWGASGAMPTSGGQFGQSENQQGQDPWPASADSRGDGQWGDQTQNDTWGQAGNKTQGAPGNGQDGNTVLNGDTWGDSNNNEQGSGGGRWSPHRNQNKNNGSRDNWNSGSNNNNNNNDDSSGGQQQNVRKWKSHDDTANVQDSAQKDDEIHW